MMLERVVDEIPEEPLQDGEFLWNLYRSKGWSQRTIAYELNKPKEKVLKALIEHNCLQPWANKETLQKALEKHQTPANVAEAFGCSEQTVRRWMHRNEIRKRPELSESLLRELHESQNLTEQEIADDLGYHPVEIHFALKEYGIERRSGSHRFRD